MANIQIKAETRTQLGRKVKALRRQGLVPGNVYGKNIKSQAITVNEKEFYSIFKEAGETKIVEILLGDKKLPTLIHNTQTDPVEDKLLHVDFLQVDLKEKVTASVPLEFIGESPAEKQGLGTVVKYEDEVEIEALPGDIPENFVIDISKFENVDDTIKVSDLKVDKTKITITDDPEKIIVKVEELRAEEVVPVVEVAAEGEVTETPAEVATEGETPEAKPQE